MELATGDYVVLVLTQGTEIDTMHVQRKKRYLNVIKMCSLIHRQTLKTIL